MKLSDFDYDLPPESIAQTPARRRDRSRLLCLPPADGLHSDHRFDELPGLLQKRGVRLLVLNDTKVIPARLLGKKETGGRVELLLIAPQEREGIWTALCKSSKPLKQGAIVQLSPAHAVKILEPLPGGHYRIDFGSGQAARETIDSQGVAPLPPYIRRNENTDPKLRALDRERYQTVYAGKDGAIAAPTAGLHFSPEIFKRLDEAGIERVMLTLHVGLGTFMPVRAKNIDEHVMHEEWFRISDEAAERINRALGKKEPIVAVGTTSCRALESAVDDTGMIRAGAARTRLFIKPGYRFRTINGLLTNFHLPKSTLLMLVSALAGRERLLGAYDHAVKTGYRFYSYGDAMLIW